MVVHAIEELRIIDGYVIGERPKEMLFEPVALLFGQPVVNGIVCLTHKDEPVRIVQALPEQLATRIGSFFRMQRQILVHRFILKQHVANINSVLFLFEDLKQCTGPLRHQVVALVPFVGITTGKIPRNRRIDPALDLGIYGSLNLCHRSVEQRNRAQLRPDSLDTGLGHNQVRVLYRV